MFLYIVNFILKTKPFEKVFVCTLQVLCKNCYEVAFKQDLKNSSPKGLRIILRNINITVIWYSVKKIELISNLLTTLPLTMIYLSNTPWNTIRFYISVHASLGSFKVFVLTALKKQNPLVRAVTTKMIKKINLNPPALLWILTAFKVSVSSRLLSSSPPTMFEIGTCTASLGTVTATLGGPSNSFRNACKI